MSSFKRLVHSNGHAVLQDKNRRASREGSTSRGKKAPIPAAVALELPQLGELLNVEKLARKLQSSMGPEFAVGRYQIDVCRIHSIRYKPGRECLVLLTAFIREDERGLTRAQLFTGILFPSSSYQAAVQFWRGRSLVAPYRGPALVEIPEWHVLLLSFPNDPRLPGLGLMADSEQVLSYLQATPSATDLDYSPLTIHAHMKKYVPGRRCGYLYRLALRSFNFQRPTANIFAKAYHDGEGEHAYRIMQQLWDSDQRKRGELLLPQPYSFDQYQKILWQEALTGLPLIKAASGSKAFAALAAETGKRLAAYHSMRLELPVQMTLAYQIDALRRSLQPMRQIFPDHAGRCERLVDRLLTAAAMLAPWPNSPVHASFGFSRIFVTARGVAFVSFDGANLGDPGQDLGRFVAQVYKMAITGRLALANAEQVFSSFCAGYNSAVTRPIPEERIRWFATSHLISSLFHEAVTRLCPAPARRMLVIADRLYANN